MTSKLPKMIFISWGVREVMLHAATMRVAVTDEQARVVLWKCQTFHDPVVGINWGVIERYIRAGLDEAKAQA